ncbi:hypothetical protein DUI87_03768 [Hirundo rustica rustica]|uniref:Uncharacterized protein n=1 Tax=Hirundo rustica rustica TaxID=333673 RepID=A0A3M0L5G9_HIRRU|nr:hypothetical protein DUI87_03768 [Hirundo rustica rustica]
MVLVVVMGVSGSGKEDTCRQDTILACSALKKMYRRVLISGASAIESNQPEQPRENSALKILFVHLDGPMDIIAGPPGEAERSFYAT